MHMKEMTSARPDACIFLDIEDGQISSCQRFSSLLLNSGFPGVSTSKESTCNVGDPGSIPGLQRSPGEGNSYPLQYDGLENSMDCIVHGVTQSQTLLSDFDFH